MVINQDFKEGLFMTKREKVRQIINDGCGGWTSPKEILEEITDIILEKLKDVEDDYDELLSAYIRL